ncbi:MAG: glycosyltransferase family 39 protein [Candidatus Omnitrophica bacterium]|nr:glycosyltransferase family 39 protein [Candidatus Omnitrophota bacterium]
MSQRSNNERRPPLAEFIVVGLIMLTAILLRIDYLNEYLTEFPDARHPLNDARMYWEMGREIYQQGVLLPNEGPYYQAPLYSYALALLHHAGIHRIESVLRIQGFIGVFSVFLVYLIARMTLPWRWACAPALLYAISHYALFFESKLLAAALGNHLFLWFAFFYILWIKRQKIGWLIAGAFIYSLAVLCRANLIFALPFLILHVSGPWRPFLLWRKNLSKRLALAFIFTSVFLIGASPAALRNYFIGGSFVPISANSGVTLYMGTNSRAQGGLGPVEGLSNDIEQQKFGSIELASKLAGKKLSPSEASSFWIRKTEAWIVENPSEFLVLEVKKLLWAFYVEPPAVNYSAHFEMQRLPFLRVLSWFTALALFLGILGLPFLLFYNSKRSDDRIPSFLLSLIAGYVLLSLVFYASDRFLASMLPIFALIGVMFIQKMCASSFKLIVLKEKTNFFRRCAILCLLLAAVMTFNPFLSWNKQREIGMGWYNLGVFYTNNKMDDDAFQAYLEAQKHIPDFPPLLLNLGVFYAERGDLERSTQLFQRVMELDPDNTQALKNLRINQQRMMP